MNMDTPKDDTAAPVAAATGPVRARHKESAADGVSAAKPPTVRGRLEERLREVPDILALLRSDHAKALVVPAKGDEDLWAAVRHFMTTTRAEGAVEFPDFLDRIIRRQLKLAEGDLSRIRDDRLVVL